MFKPQRPEESNAQATASPREGTARPAGGGRSVIASDMKVVGNLASRGELQIDGEIDGDIKATTVTVGRGATISGSILADRVDVHGTVKGQIDGATVSLSANARIEGDVVHDSLAVEAGAYLNGHVRRRTSKPAASTATASTSSSTATGQASAAPGHSSSASAGASGSGTTGGGWATGGSSKP